LDDKKAALKKATNNKSKSDMVLGVKLCGSNYMEAYQFYWNLGEYYFSFASKNKGILPAVKACYIIAAENLIQINQTIKDEEQKVANKKKMGEILKL
jgi:hypothetical protein